jgi:hypothetical protein
VSDTVIPNRVPSKQALEGRPHRLELPTWDFGEHPVTESPAEKRRPLPNLLGAIWSRFGPIENDDLPDAQRADVALLLRLVENPDDLSRIEKRWLRRHEYFGDTDNPMWDRFSAETPEDSALVFRRLIA